MQEIQFSMQSLRYLPSSPFLRKVVDRCSKRNCGVLTKGPRNPSSPNTLRKKMNSYTKKMLIGHANPPEKQRNWLFKYCTSFLNDRTQWTSTCSLNLLIMLTTRNESQREYCFLVCVLFIYWFTFLFVVLKKRGKNSHGVSGYWWTNYFACLRGQFVSCSMWLPIAWPSQHKFLWLALQLEL